MPPPLTPDPPASHGFISECMLCILRKFSSHDEVSDLVDFLESSDMMDMASLRPLMFPVLFLPRMGWNAPISLDSEELCLWNGARLCSFSSLSLSPKSDCSGGSRSLVLSIRSGKLRVRPDMPREKPDPMRSDMVRLLSRDLELLLVVPVDCLRWAVVPPPVPGAGPVAPCCCCSFCAAGGGIDVDSSKTPEKPFLDSPIALTSDMVKSVAIDMCGGNSDSALPLDEDTAVRRFVTRLVNPVTTSIVWCMPCATAIAAGAMSGGMGEDDFFLECFLPLSWGGAVNCGCGCGGGGPLL
mmetsp:Transcript_734/g.1555  ORF Transcript_734/g.1555 Transcript_734/m.1555 type:complete len:297 (-) Transcript_734:1289-2179(-)